MAGDTRPVPAPAHSVFWAFRGIAEIRSANPILVQPPSSHVRVAPKEHLCLVPLGSGFLVASDILEVTPPTPRCLICILILSAAAYRNLGQNLWGPHRYGCLAGVRVRTVVSGSCAAHSLLITTEGKLWSWGEYRVGAGHWGPLSPAVPTQHFLLFAWKRDSRLRRLGSFVHSPRLFS